MTDKMREEFKTWHDGITGSSVEFNDAGIPVSIGSALSDTVTIGMWVAWRASRESLCVELPKYYSTDSVGLAYCADAVVDSLDAAGVPYK